MDNFFLSHLNTIGLLFDIVGSLILFFVVLSIGEQVRRADQGQENIRSKKEKMKKNAQKIGFAFIFLGFLMQFISNEMNNSKLNECKCRIEICTNYIPLHFQNLKHLPQRFL